MQINIKLKGTTVSVHPLTPELNGQGNQTLQWNAQDDSDQFDFDNPPITFDASDAPITGISGNGNAASATDNVNTQGDYTYHVHLIDSQGNHITYPSTSGGSNTMTASLVSAKNMLGTGTDPTIRNRPQ